MPSVGCSIRGGAGAGRAAPSPPLLRTCPALFYVILLSPCCCWRATRVTLRKDFFLFPPYLNGSFERQSLSVYIPAVRIESILRSALGGGKKRRKKPHKEGKLTGLTIGVIDSGWRSGCDIGLCRGDAGARWGNPAKPFFPEPGADRLGEGWPYELNNSSVVGT